MAFVALIVLVGIAVDVLFNFGLAGVLVALVIATMMAGFSYFNSDKVALAVTGAKPADPNEYQRFHNLVEGLCIASGLPKPRLYVINDPAPNAFATGRNPKHAALAATTGLLGMMNRVELEGVIAHELSHVKNYDILAATVAVTAVGAIALLADLGLRFWIFGGRSNRSDGYDLAYLGPSRGSIDAIFDEPKARTSRRRHGSAIDSLPPRIMCRAQEAPSRYGGGSSRD